MTCEKVQKAENPGKVKSDWTAASFTGVFSRQVVFVDGNGLFHYRGEPECRGLTNEILSDFLPFTLN